MGTEVLGRDEEGMGREKGEGLDGVGDRYELGRGGLELRWNLRIDMQPEGCLVLKCWLENSFKDKCKRAIKCS